jgi:hypothetical protein
MKVRFVVPALLAAWIGGADWARAELRLAPCFTSNMVIQRDVPARLVGWADAGETVVVKLGQEVVGRATGKGHDKDACWTVALPVQKGPWCGFGGVANAEQEVAAANHPQARRGAGDPMAWPVPSGEKAGVVTATVPDGQALVYPVDLSRSVGGSCGNYRASQQGVNQFE